MANMWMVRAGENAFLIDDFIELNIVSIGWQLGDLSNKNYDDIKKLMNNVYSEYDKNRLSKNASQINKFVNEFKINDYVISYNSFNRKYYVGKIVSDYYYSNLLTKKYNKDCYSHFRNVEWLGEVSRDDLKNNSRKSLNGLMTIFSINSEIMEEILYKMEKYDTFSIINDFKYILNKNFNKKFNENDFLKWIENDFSIHFEDYFNNICINNSLYESKVKFASNSKVVLISIFNKAFLNYNPSNDFLINVMIKNNKEIELGFKLGITDKNLLVNRLSFIKHEIEKKFPDLIDKIILKKNRLNLFNLKYDDINLAGLNYIFNQLINIFEYIIPEYMDFLSNEPPFGSSLRNSDEMKIWELDLGNYSEFDEDLLDELKTNSYITLGFIKKHNNVNYSNFKNKYSISNYFSDKLSKNCVTYIWQFVNFLKKDDIVFIVDKNKLEGVCVIKSDFDRNKNGFHVDWIANFNNLNITTNVKYISEMSLSNFNNLILNISKYNKKFLENVSTFLYDLFNNSGNDSLSNFENHEQYINNIWEELLNKKEQNIDISNEIWDKIIHVIFDNDVKSIIQEKTNFSDSKLSEISNSFFNSINELKECNNIQKQKSIIKEFFEYYSPEKIEYNLFRQFIEVLHYLNKEYFPVDKKLVKTLYKLSLIVGFNLNRTINFNNYIDYNREVKYLLQIINNNSFFKKFNLIDIKNLILFSEMLYNKENGIFYGNNQNIFPLTLFENVNEFNLNEIYSELSLNKLLIETSLFNFSISDKLIYHISASLNSGKHIILDGTPGTGKTELAKIISSVSDDCKFSNGYILTTATSDWSTFDTIGGLMPNSKGELVFHQGKFLEAISENKWLIIDEINRSDIDKAFGQLFTVLSGQDVELPYKFNGSPIKIKNWEKLYSTFNQETATYFIGKNWRIIGTMNVDDKDSLFDLSYAFMRRFMFIEVDLPCEEDYKKLIKIWANDLDEEYLYKLIKIYGIVKYRKLGPAVFKDMISYIRERDKLGLPDNNEVLGEAIDSYILPQLEGLNRKRINDIEMFFEEIGLLEHISDKFNELKLDL